MMARLRDSAMPARYRTSVANQRMSADHILETRHLTKEFKGFVAVNRVDLKVRRGKRGPRAH